MNGTDAFTVEGSTLRQQRIALPGHKHSTVPILAATLACPRPVRLRNVPDLLDVRLLLDILARGGAQSTIQGDQVLIDTRGYREPAIPPGPARAIHGSLYLLPAVLGRLGTVSFPGAGGCPIGSASDRGLRPVHHVVQVLEAFGARLQERAGSLVGFASGLHAAQIDVDRFSTRPGHREGPLLSGATKTGLICGALARSGPSVIDHPYGKIDVQELWRFLHAARGVEPARPWSDRRIDMRPVSRDESAPLEYTLPADLSALMTWVSVAVLHRVPLTVVGARLDAAREGLAPELELAEAMGVSFRWEPSSVQIIPPETVRSLDFAVSPDGIFSDHQPFFALMLLNGDRPARIVEKVWPERFSYAAELAKLGARVEIEDSAVRIHPSRLTGGAELNAGDLRAAAALLIAALAAPGTSIVRGTHHLERGYPHLADDLRLLGAQVQSDDAAGARRAHAL